MLEAYLKDDLKDQLLLFSEEIEILLLNKNYKKIVKLVASILELSTELGYENLIIYFSFLLDIFAILAEENEENIDEDVIDLLLISCDSLKEDFKDDIYNLNFDSIFLETFSLQQVKSIVLKINKTKLEKLNILSFLEFNVSDDDKFILLKDLKQGIKLDAVLIPNDEEIFLDLKDRFNVPVVIVLESDNETPVQSAKFVVSKEDLDSFYSKLLEIIDSNRCQFLKDSILIDIDNLKALPDTISKLQKLPSDASLRDISSIIMQDFILSSQLLKEVNSPIYGLKKEVQSVNQAITLLGKEKVLGIATQVGVLSSMKLHFDSYGITESEFKNLSLKRMKLVLHWISKVKFELLPILTTTAVLGNIGQLILSKEIENVGKVDEFQKLLEIDRVFAENKIVGITSEEVTAHILSHWGFDTDLVESFRYSVDILSANNDIKSLAVINYIVYNSFDLHGNLVTDSKLKLLKSFIEEMNLNVEAYEKAIKKVS